MFKIESYITPVILSYVEKYVKNFKPEQSQVSLWGGDASFQNLDLRLEVLEEQLNLPFTFVSGHIHELLIHVPWVKITSEPIVVTINTIECILNLKNQGQVDRSTLSHRGSGLKALQEESPPGYIKSIVTKVINNITINCNNLILKYVEEDIVLSVNVRFLSMQTVNELWEPTFAEVSSSEVTLRKIIAVEDLTLCLDKMDTAGKIDIYQDPVLYRCSMLIRLMMNYHSNSAKCASLTRFDLHCEKMEFSLTEQQLPMLLRLISLITSLQTKQSNVRNDKSIHSSDERIDISQDDEEQVHGTSSDGPGWSGWAWNTVTSFLPVDWDADWSEEQQIASTGHVIHMGIYIDEAILTFKTIETLQEQLFYKSRKIRYNSILTLKVTSAIMSLLVKGISLSNIRFGIGSIRLHPQGNCSCGYPEVIDEMQPPIYIEAGVIRDDYLKDSLFDKNLVEIKNWKTHYNEYNIDYHLEKIDVTSILEKTSAFGIDIIHSIEMPEDFPVEKLPEFESNFEYSNFPERKVIRCVIGDLKVQHCTGFMHRLNAVKSAAKYDSNLYLTKKPEPTFEELPPVTVEEYEALRESVSVVQTYFHFYRLAIKLKLTDHSISTTCNQKLVSKSRFSASDPTLSNNAHLSIEASEITGSIIEPMYPFRLASCASRQTDIAPDMLNDCYLISELKITGMQSQLYLNKHCHTMIIMPCNVNLTRKSLIFPQYWQKNSVIQDKIEAEIDDITFTGSKAKLLVAASIALTLKDSTDTSNPIFSSSLFMDACNEKDPVHLEISLENLFCERVTSASTISIKIDVNSIKAFALNDNQQAFILSGPEVDNNEENNDTALFTAILQYPKTVSDQLDPSILSFRVSEMRGSFDPLLSQWLQYQPVYIKSKESYTTRPEVETAIAEDTFSDTDVRKKIFRSLHESVHSVSDKEKRRSSSRTDWSKGVSGGAEDLIKKIPTNDDNELEDLQKPGTIIKIAQLYPFWRKLVLCGSIGHLVIYLPTMTMDGIGVAGIEPAKDRALTGDSNLHIFAIKSPTVLIHSTNVQVEKLSLYLKKIPARLPRGLWLPDYHSFPWTLKLSNLSCYTLKQNSKTNLIRNVDFTATIDITTKNSVTEFNDCSHVGLGLCVYVDTSPIIISLCEEQIMVLNNIATDVTKVLKFLYPEDAKIPDEIQTELEPTYFDIPKTPSSYNPVVYPENTSPSSISTARDSSDQTGAETENPIITAMIQWTIAKVSLKLYTFEQLTNQPIKLLFELEDMITTFDWQPIYLKFKNKITTATICHYIRELEQENWIMGDYAGLIMLGRESSSEQTEDTGFLSITYTKAQSGNVHTRWGAQKHQKSQKIRARRDCPLSAEGYITEIDMMLQRVDIILPPRIINKFLLLLKPIISANSIDDISNLNNEKIPVLRCDNFENKSLPLIYLEFKGMNLMVPTLSDFDYILQHDLLMVQIDGISITPSTENPICRSVLRTDIYQLAAQSNILNIPGSSVEDRQYQVSIRGICACTTTWQNYQQNVPKRTSQSYLYTMNENPALEWNNLTSDGNSEPQFSTSFLTSRIDVRLIIAPAIVLPPSKIICGGAFELTCLTDIEISINIDQLKLLWCIYKEIGNFLFDYSKSKKNSDNPTDAKIQASLLAATISQEFQGNFSLKEHETDFTGDSGVDFESSSVNYAATKKTPAYRNSTPLPLEILINCGSVTISLHTVTSKPVEDTEIEYEENGSDKLNFEASSFHVTLVEPNFYISQLNEKEKVQISCFDVAISISNIIGTGLRENEKLPLIESKNGSPHPETGIPPSFIILKWEKNYCNNMELFVDVGRPTKINFSMLAVKQIDYIKEKISKCFTDYEISRCCRSNFSENNMEYQNKATPENKMMNFDVPEIRFKTKQIVLSLNTIADSNILISVSSSSGKSSRTVKMEKIRGDLNFNALVISIQYSNDIKVFLKPSNFSVKANVFWETWQDIIEDPQIKIQAKSETVYFEFGPKHMKILENIMEEYRVFMNYLKMNSELHGEETTGSRPLTEQNYKDDLKAGAFQFVDSNIEEMPSPYQVVFYTYPEKAMAWKYPQPRIITGLYVSPIPYEISDDMDFQEDFIKCSLEYWSESHNSYRHYIEFILSETENSRPELPSTSQPVSSTWRVVMSTGVKGNSIIAPQVLVGCLRIDSYFNSSIVPNLQIVVKIETTKISITNHVESSIYLNLPEPLSNFRLNGHIPEVQCFLQLEHEKTSIVFNRWLNGDALIDTSGDLIVKVLDYGLLHMQKIIDHLESNIQVSLSEKSNVSIECNPFTLKFGPSIAHTLAVSTNLWLASFENEAKNVAMLTRIIVANDTNISIKFGQCGSNDDILLQSRDCHFYFWRYPNKRVLSIAIEATGWTWSRPFNVNKNGKQLLIFGNSGELPKIIVKVESISATQKLVTFSGLLVITNRLMECFQMKLVKNHTKDDNKPVVLDEIYLINGKHQPPSIVLENKANMAMRLRFISPSNLSWTGDIPLKTNARFGQPWLVKVPLQDRGQFLSIWVRIVEENVHGETRILVVMSPLYMIKSFLPVPVVIKIDTPSLSMTSSATIMGQGKCQQLYCPGTFEHCHQLTFQFESSMSASNPYVPLSYSSIEERTFFARPRNEDIDAILMELEKPEQISYLPFQADHPNIQISADQPQTHVQIKYRDAGFVSSTLLLELQPWCFIFNTLGCHISVLAEDIELCQIPHNGIITPPKLEGTFHLRIMVENKDYISPALQLARPDWNPGFYMPRIRGLVPVDGNIQTSSECDTNICVISVNSKMHEDMRFVRIMASHVICNFTPYEFRVSCIAIGQTSSRLQLSENQLGQSFTISPNENRSQGIPIIQWHLVDTKKNSENEALYILLGRDSSWSCPIRVDEKIITRRCTSISDVSGGIPLVIITQEDEGVIYIIIHVDDHPQLHIENLCPFSILLGQANGDDGICEEAAHFYWRFKIKTGEASYYTTPSTANKMPDCQTVELLPKLKLAASTHLENKSAGEKDSMWSRPINLSQVTNCRIEQYVRLPVYGDIKLLMEKRCHTIHIRVVCMSQVEVSAHDIRTRLILEESKSPEIQSVKSFRFDTGNEEKEAPECLIPESIGVQPEEFLENDKEEEAHKSISKLKPDESGRVKSLKGALTLYIRGVNVIIMQDMNENAQRVEVASLCLSDLILLMNSNEKSLTLCACVGDLQLDNQMYNEGGFDFPVVFMSQKPYTSRGSCFYGKVESKNLIAVIKSQSLIVLDCTWEVDDHIYACTNVDIKIGPASAYIEDTFISQLLEYTTSASPPCFNMSSGVSTRGQIEFFNNAVSIPEHVVLEALNLKTPLRLEKFTIDPIFLLLSVHTSIRLYVALDHSPLYFGAFERNHLVTTPGGLANALTTHYLSGALFGAGWVVGSLEILGSPGGFAQALGTGLKDFVTLPIQGILRGPWSFLIGITQGSASLMKHLTAGTVNSVTKLASSVARNLDRLTLDDEHLQRQEESRRTRPQGMAQGLYQGLTGFGMSLLAAVAGLAHHPLQQVLSGVATPRGLVTGVGLGIVGAVTKPLSGAAELVALTGQGLLEGTGWNPLPMARQRPIIENVDRAADSFFKFIWRLLRLLIEDADRILHVVDANYIIGEEIHKKVMLILTRKTLVLANVDEGNVEKIYLLKKLTSVEHVSDPTLLCLYCMQIQNLPARSVSPIEYPEMDQAMRVRVEQFVRGSSSNFSTYPQSPTIDLIASNPNNTLTFSIEAENKNYFLSMFRVAKRQDEGCDFIVL